SEAFLSHFGLDALGDLPGLEELKGAGLLDGRLPPGFAVPVPSDDPALRDDEEPLEPGDLDLGLAPSPERTPEGLPTFMLGHSPSEGRRRFAPPMSRAPTTLLSCSKQDAGGRDKPRP